MKSGSSMLKAVLANSLHPPLSPVLASCQVALSVHRQTFCLSPPRQNPLHNSLLFCVLVRRVSAYLITALRIALPKSLVLQVKLLAMIPPKVSNIGIVQRVGQSRRITVF